VAAPVSGPAPADAAGLPHCMVVVAMGQPKVYTSNYSGLAETKFFAKGKERGTQELVLSMFNVAHAGKFVVGDEIAFEGRSSTSKNTGERWIGVQADDRVVRIGRAQAVDVAGIYDVTYIGWPKARANGEFVSSGMLADGSWGLDLPMEVMRAYFENRDPAEQEAQVPTGPIGPGFYGVLMIPQAATADELKAAFRKLSKMYHPDLSDAPDAATLFINLKKAYDTLSDPALRAKHDAILRMTSTSSDYAPLTTNVVLGASTTSNWGPTYRCGKITIQGTTFGGNVRVQKITGWVLNKRRRIISKSAAEIRFLDAGIEFMVAYGKAVIPFSVPNSKLPFVSRAAMDGKVRCALAIEMQEVQDAFWKKGPDPAEPLVGSKPESFWIGQEVLSVVGGPY
jgi:hypothetical protein